VLQRQGVEDDDLVDPVQEFGPEGPLESFFDLLPAFPGFVVQIDGALFARGGTGFDRNVWTAAVNLESLSLLDR